MTVNELINSLLKVENKNALVRLGNGWDELNYGGLVSRAHDEILHIDDYKHVVYLDTLNNSGGEA